MTFIYPIGSFLVFKRTDVRSHGMCDVQVVCTAHAMWHTARASVTAARDAATALAATKHQTQPRTIYYRTVAPNLAHLSEHRSQRSKGFIPVALAWALETEDSSRSLMKCGRRIGASWPNEVVADARRLADTSLKRPASISRLRALARCSHGSANHELNASGPALGSLFHLASWFPTKFSTKLSSNSPRNFHLHFS